MDQITFSVQNLGVIKSGEFAIKPLTLFCGPNNTGKTWLMYSIYAFLNKYHISSPGIIIEKIVESLNENGSYQGDLKDFLEKPSDKAIELDLDAQELAEVFNIEEAILGDASFASVTDRKILIQNIRDKPFSYSSKILNCNKQAGDTILEIKLISQPSSLNQLRYHLLSVVPRLLFNFPEPFLMPAERNGLHLFFRELSAKRTALLHHASKEKIDLHKLLQDVMKSRYALPIANYIDWLNDLPNIRNATDPKFHLIAEKVRADVSHGKYMVNRDGEILFKPRKLNRDPKEAQPHRMGLHATSSTVKSLFGLWFYLERQAKPGNVLMIDEPELHLHPANQRLLARILVQLVNAGLQVIISTHSDYLVRELNSLIMLSAESPERKRLMEKYGFEQEQLLDRSKVAAYLVNERKIEGFKITAREGILASTFDEVINDLNESSDDIYYTYKEDESVDG